jgi:hypothetical protein
LPRHPDSRSPTVRLLKYTFTSSGTDEVFDNFALNDQNKPLDHHQDGVSTITFLSDDTIGLALDVEEWPTPENIISLDLSHRDHAENDKTSDLGRGI